jgi:hypothetical protein
MKHDNHCQLKKSRGDKTKKRVISVFSQAHRDGEKSMLRAGQGFLRVLLCSLFDKENLFGFSISS